MPTEMLAAHATRAMRHWWPEALLAVLAGVVFLGCLGSVDLWGKREQRASAEAIDTVDHQHWLVAQIQGRPRLEKPPLPRWSIAALMVLTGRRDEWIVRLPGAFSALATVALIYFLGRRIGGRPVGLASALVLCSLGFYVGEMRQASNDGPLALFTTLALCAAWCRLHVDDDDPADQPARRSLGVRASWNLVLYAALGLGILTKGPVILLLVGVTVIPYLAISGKLVWGLRRLADVRGLLLFATMGLIWPIAVLLQDPSALGVWSLEMSEKTGLSRIFPHIRHTLLLEQWPGIVLPWSLIAVVAVLLPFLPKNLSLGLKPDRAAGIDPSSGRGSWSSPHWFPWWWAVGNLGMFCFWTVAKPNYYVPCLPGMALLIGLTWVRLARVARDSRRRGGGGAADLAGPMGGHLCRGDGGPAGAPAVDPCGCLALVVGDRAGVGHFGRDQRSCLEARGRRLDPGAALRRICCRHRGRLRDHCPNRKLATQPPRTGSKPPAPDSRRGPYPDVLQRDRRRTLVLLEPTRTGRQPCSCARLSSALQLGL